MLSRSACVRSPECQWDDMIYFYFRMIRAGGRCSRHNRAAAAAAAAAPHSPQSRSERSEWVPCSVEVTLRPQFIDRARPLERGEAPERGTGPRLASRFTL
jgi:hypothetical protein